MIRVFASLVLLACAAIPSSAALTTYTSLTSFNAATGSDTFSNLTFPTGSDGTSYTDPTSGVTFTSAHGMTGITAPTGWPADSSLEVVNSGNTNMLTIVLPSLVTAVAFYLGPQDYSTFNVDVTNSGGDGYHNGATMQSNPNTPVFLGITSSTPFSSFTLTTWANVDHLVIDDMEVGEAGSGGGSQNADTPEIATLLMIGSGLVMLRCGRRWLPRLG